MKLLMITRKIDRSDWLAGHGYEWAKSISQQLATTGGQLRVLCLEKGETEGIGVEVVSLGKESGAGRARRFWNFQKVAAALVKESDGIFCHQNPEYAIAVAFWAKIYGKKIVSWYAHKSVTWKTRLMLWLSDKVLTASKESFRLPSPKVSIVGHGIDVDKFKIQNSKFKITDQNAKFNIITVGRISPVKNLHILIDAIKILQTKSFDPVELQIVGGMGLPADKAYFERLQRQVVDLHLEAVVRFVPPVPHYLIHEVYQQADLFVNLSQTGSLDKALLEAMACGCAALTSNEAFFSVLAPFSDLCLIKTNEPQQLAAKIEKMRKLNASDQMTLSVNLRRIVLNGHGLDNLSLKIIQAFSVNV